MIYGLGHVSQQVLALVTLPIFARLLSPAEYGLLETLATVSAVVGLVAYFCLDSGLQRIYFDYPPEQREQRRGVVVTALAAVAVWNILLLLVLSPACEMTMRWLQGPPGSGTILWMALASQSLAYPSQLAREVLRLQHRPWAYSILALAQSVLWLAGSLYFIAWRHDGIHGYYLGSLLAVAGIFPLAMGMIWSELKGRINRHDLLAMLRFAGPLVPAAGAGWLMTMVDRLILNHWLDISAIGYYGMAQKTTRLIGLITMAFSVSWAPLILQLAAQDPDQEKQLRARVAPIYFLALGFAAVALTGLAPEVIDLLASATFAPAAALVGPLCLGAVGTGLTALLATGISLAKQTRYFAVFTIACGLVNVAANLLLVPFFGAAGSAWATAFSFALLNLAYYRTAQRLMPAPHDGRALIAIAGLTVAFTVLAGQTSALSPRLVLVLAFLPVAYMAGLLDRQLVRTAVAQGWGRWRP
jgi:O-antigen/teichoic acid export membrane protein